MISEACGYLRFALVIIAGCVWLYIHAHRDAKKNSPRADADLIPPYIEDATDEDLIEEILLTDEAFWKG